MDKCPSSYYVDTNNFCQQCSNNPTACVLPPLNFTFYTETVSYSLFIVVVFNRDINLNSNMFFRYARFRTGRGPIKSSDYSMAASTSRMFRLRMRDSSSLN